MSLNKNNRTENRHPSSAPEKLTVLVVEPFKAPYVKEIDHGLQALQSEVGGDIEVCYPYKDPVGLVLNEEGKLIGLEPNRSLRDEHGEMYDVVAGPFLVVGLGQSDFVSLSQEMIQKYSDHFRHPELFIQINEQIVSIPLDADRMHAAAHRTAHEEKPSVHRQLTDAQKRGNRRKMTDRPSRRRTEPDLNK